MEIGFSPKNLRITVLETDTWTNVAQIINTKAYHLAFSPKNTYLMSWEPFTVSNANPEGSPNLKIYKTDGGELVKSFIQKKQINWFVMIFSLTVLWFIIFY